jgi:hypothetical protein
MSVFSQHPNSESFTAPLVKRRQDGISPAIQ